MLKIVCTYVCKRASATCLLHKPCHLYHISHVRINKVILIGHLGKDPMLRILEDDIAVVSFPFATSVGYTKNGVRIEETEWHNIIMWRSVAECAAKILKKGKLVYIEGKARTRNFEDKAGIKKYITEIIADNFTLLGSLSDFEDEPERLA